MAFTEAPGMTWNYKTGKIEKRPGGFSGPENLYRNRTDADTVMDIENYIGFDSEGNPVHLKEDVYKRQEYMWSIWRMAVCIRSRSPIRV